MSLRYPLPAVLALCLTLACVCACNPNKKQDVQGADGTASNSSKPAAVGPAKKLTILFASTESDPWASEMISTIGAELGFDPWQGYRQEGHIDVYGPHNGQLGTQALEVSIGLAGLTGIADLLSQQTLGEEARNWISATSPDLVWLDGDQAQFMVGRELDPALPLIFSGTIGEREFYYEESRKVTGVYRRYSLTRVIAELWRKDEKVGSIALLSDDSTPGQGQREQFRRQLEMMLPGSTKRNPPPAVQSWAELREQMTQDSEAQGLIISGFQEDSAPAGLLNAPCPADLLEGVTKPVVALGPSLLDGSGAISLRLVPSAHAQAALDLAGEVLAGVDPGSLLPVTPDAMQRFVNE